MVGIVRRFIPQRAVDYVRSKGRRLVCCISKSSSSSDTVRFSKERDANKEYRNEGGDNGVFENDENESLLQMTSVLNSPGQTVVEENELGSDSLILDVKECPTE